jgi:hypothetical protein
MVGLRDSQLFALLLKTLNVKMLPSDEIYKRYKQVMFDILVFFLKVVMQSGDAELEMRGRCSAGQKVFHCWW